MSRRQGMVLIGLILAMLGWWEIQPARAHDIIPKDVYEYLQTHPTATPDEVKLFIAQNDSAFADKYDNNTSIQRLIDRKNATLTQTIWDFIQLGVGHILSGPDHILFVLSLLLVFVSFRHILKITATFTISHSITLILAGTGLLTLPSHVVEPLIALSIAVVALATVFLANHSWMKNQQTKFAAVFFFGLFHGLGFAGLLSEIHIPDGQFVPALISFNVGIECGQILIVLLALPLIYLFRKRIWYAKMIKCVAVFISIAALIWFMQRLP